MSFGASKSPLRGSPKVAPLSLGFELVINTRRRLRQQVGAVVAVWIVATFWTVWSLHGEGAHLALVVGLGIGSLGVMFWGVRRLRARGVTGRLTVLDDGSAIWQDERAAVGHAPGSVLGAGAAARPTRWHRTERSMWLRLETGPGQSFDLAAGLEEMTEHDWSALQRWLLWLERGAGS